VELENSPERVVGADWLGLEDLLGAGAGEGPGGVRYSKTPGVFFVMNNSRRLLERASQLLGEMGYTPKVGLEVEFYGGRIGSPEELDGLLGDFARTAAIGYGGVTREVGRNQFEVSLSPQLAMGKLVDDFLLVKNFLLASDPAVSFDAMPSYYQPRSALQMNVSLNGGDGVNLFARSGDGEESRLLLNSVAGLLATTNSFLPLYLGPGGDPLVMFDEEFNRAIHSQGRNPMPTYNSWGINNRSCSVRIPTPKNFFSEKDYRIDSRLNRRIEFRVATADSNVECALFGLLYSLLYGIQNGLEPPPATSNNVLEYHEGFRRIAFEDNILSIIHPSFFSCD
jgi:glutamine synthetase